MAAVKTMKNTGEVASSKIFPILFNKELTSEMDVIAMSKRGVTKKSLILIGEYFGFTPDRLAYMLPITLRTIQRYKNTQKFNPAVSEHIIQLARLMVRGTEVFESRENFLRWFTTPNTALGGNVPSDLVSLQTGAQLVMDELTRIDHGVFA
jgi:putative toxin-antitoxin system antitoxin component (TIGR02293 family)